MTVAELQALEARYAMPTYPRAPVEFVRGEGARLWDSDGREYLDFFAGLSVHNAGHCHPRIVAAIVEQAGRLRRDVEPVLLRARDQALRAALELESRRPRLPRQQRDRGQRVRDQAGPQARPCARDRRARDHQPGRRLSRPYPGARSPPPRGSPARTCSGRCPAASSPFPATIPRRCARRSPSGPRRSWSSRSRARPGSSRSPTRSWSPPARRVTPQGRRSSSTRSRPGSAGPGACGPSSSSRSHRTCSPRARRSAAACRRRRRSPRRRSATGSSWASTAPPSAAARSPPRRRWRRSS